jgi:hypothetical protein
MEVKSSYFEGWVSRDETLQLIITHMYIPGNWRSSRIFENGFKTLNTNGGLAVQMD